MQNTGYDLMAQDVKEAIEYINQNKELEKCFADMDDAGLNKFEDCDKTQTDCEDGKKEINSGDFADLSTRLTTLRKHLSNEAEIGNKLETYIKKMDEETFEEGDLKGVLALIDKVESKNSEFIELVLMETYLTILRTGSVNDNIKKFVFRKLSELQGETSLRHKKGLNSEANSYRKPERRTCKVSSKGMEKFLADLMDVM